MRHNLAINRDENWPRLHAVATAAIIIFFTLCPLAPVRWYDLYLSYGKAAIIAVAAVYFFKCGFRGPVEVKLVIYYGIWLFLTRLLNTDYYLQNELDLVISRLLCCVVLPTGMLLDAKQRERLLDIFIALVCGFYFVVAILGIYACFLGIYFFIPPEDVAFGINSNYLLDTFFYVVPLDTNRTISAVWFYLSLCLMVYEFIRCRNKLWRIPITAAGAVFYLAVALSFCRSIKLVICVNIAMLLILWGLRLFRAKKPALRILLITLMAVVSLPLSYKSFDLLTAGTQKLYDIIDPDVERTSEQFMMFQYMEQRPEEGDFGDNRDMAKSLSNGSQRLGIFKSTVPTIKEDPLRLVIGKYSSKIMDIPHKYQNYPYFHMHNYLLQTLMLTGLPGLILVAAFSLLLAIKMIKLFFSGHPSATAAVKSLCLPLSGILMYGMFETVIFTNCADDRAPTDFRELCFFLLAGVVLAYYYEASAGEK